ncbi:MAG: hypothetical protein JO354_08335 [Verrucomicrobia bacterium]|nr:hypothetical protein [Verrucomicrobiota bacterium]
MKRFTLTLMCACIAPLAFAQSPSPEGSAAATSSTETTTSSNEATTSSSETASGTVTTHNRKTIVIKEHDNPVSYVLGKTVHYVDKTGKEIDRHVIQPGKRVILHYTGTGEHRRVERVEVQD